MQPSAKYFSEKLNHCLDDLGVPAGRERSVIFGKMLHIPKQQAWSLLEGHLYPDDSLLHQIAVELEVDVSYFQK